MRSQHINSTKTLTLNHAEYKVKTEIGSSTACENFEERNKWEYNVCSRHGGLFYTDWWLDRNEMK